MKTRQFAPLLLASLTGPLAVPAGAQTITAEQVLEKVRAAYGSLKSVHVIAEREESNLVDGHPFSASSECELAAAPGNRYYARFKTPDEDAIVMSDGNNLSLIHI